jgi:phospholipid/cholesterol/gamma-HCH transport system ATP-binding protein
MTNPNHLASLQNVTFKRGERGILNNMSLSIARGKITAIMGPSGCGKTTLLKLLTLQLQPNTGSVNIFGEDASYYASNEKLLALRQRIGILFQSGALFSGLSAFDNVAFPLRQHTKLSERMIRELVLIKLHMVGLRGARDLMPNELSGGMNRRVALARTIALDPELILYDEPFAGQDPISMGVLKDLIEKLNSALGVTSIIVSHDIAETTEIADELYVIASGDIIGAGETQQVKQMDNPLLKQFFNGQADGPIAFHFPAPSYAHDMGLNT